MFLKNIKVKLDLVREGAVCVYTCLSDGSRIIPSSPAIMKLPEISVSPQTRVLSINVLVGAHP